MGLKWSFWSADFIAVLEAKPPTSNCWEKLRFVDFVSGVEKLTGARLRGRRTATQRSKKGSEKVLERVLGKGSQKGSEKGVCCGICSLKGFWEGFWEGVLRRGFPEGAQNAPL